MIALIIALQIYLVGTGIMLVAGLLVYLMFPSDETDRKMGHTIISNAFRWPWLLACRIVQAFKLAATEFKRNQS